MTFLLTFLAAFAGAVLNDLLRNALVAYQRKRNRARGLDLMGKQLGIERGKLSDAEYSKLIWDRVVEPQPFMSKGGDA